MLQDALALVAQHGAPPGVDEAHLQWRLARCARNAGERARALQAFQAAYTLFSERGNKFAAAELTAELARAPGFVGIGWGLPLALNTTALAAMSSAEQAGHPDLIAQLRLNALGLSPAASAEAEIDAIGRLAEAHGLREQLAGVAVLRGAVAFARGQLAEAEAAYRLAADRFEAISMFQQAGGHRQNEGWLACNTRGLDAGLAVQASALALARRSGSAIGIDARTAQQASLLVLRGAYAEAVQDLGEPAGFHGGERIVRAWVAELGGDLGRALDLIEGADPSDPLPYVSRRPGLRARLLMRTGDDAVARTALTEWKGLLHGEQTGNGNMWSAMLASADEAAARLGTDELVRELYDRLAQQPLLRMTPLGTLDHLRGRLALRLERPLEEAEQHFRTGLEWCDRERCPVEAGRNLQGLAEVAERRGDIETARAHLDAAGALFAQYGAKLYLDEVLARKQVLRA